MLGLSDDQSELLAQRSTRPIYLVSIDAGRTEHLSTSGPVMLGETFYGSGVSLLSLEDWSAARIGLPGTRENIEWLDGQSWRRGACTISLLPAGRFVWPWDPDYAEDDYGLIGEVYGDPVLLLPGVIVGGGYSAAGGVQMDVVHVSRVTKWAPSLRLTAPLCNHLPRPGTVLTVGDLSIALEAS